MTINVGAERDHDLIRGGRVKGSGGVIGGPEDRVSSWPLFGDASSPGVGAVLIRRAVWQVIPVGNLDRRRKRRAAIRRLDQENLIVVVLRVGERVIEVLVHDIERPIGGGEGLRELIGVAVSL